MASSKPFGFPLRSLGLDPNQVLVRPLHPSRFLVGSPSNSDLFVVLY